MQRLLTGLAAAAGAAFCALAAGVPALADATYYVPPTFRHQVLPAYPDTARVAHETGKVFVKVLVMTDGSIAKKGGVTLFKSSGHPDLDKAVLDSVKASTFKPASRNGQAAVAFMDVIYQFNLHGVVEAGGNTSDLARALQSNPRDTNTRLKLANGYEMKQDYASAESVLKEGTSLDPSNATLWSRLGTAYYADATQTKSNSKYALAAQAFDKALSINPRVDTSGVAVVAYTTYAVNSIVAGEYNTALQYAQKASQLDPKRADAQITLGQAQAGLGNFQAALTAFKQAQQLDNHRSATVTALILTFVGQTQLKLGDESDGFASLRQAEQVDAHNPRPYQALADYYLTKGNWSAALTPLQQLAAIKPNDATTKARIAEVYIQAKNWAQAKTEIDAALKLDPNNASALFAQAELAANQGDSVGADAALQRAIAADKASTSVFNDLIARIYLQQNNHTADAERYARAATQADANNAGAWYDLGVALANETKRSAAGDALKKAYTLFKSGGNTDGAAAAAKAYKQVTGSDITTT